jgi:hypothetical protein
VPSVTALYCYPIKGCAGVEATRAELRPAGLAHDRSFAVVDEHGQCRTQRRAPRLVLVQPAVAEDGTRLRLRAQGLGELDIEVVTEGPRRAVSMLGTPLGGIDQGNAVAGWLSELLGSPSRLVRVPPEHDRVTDGETSGTSGYADSCAVHLVSMSSLRLLNQRLVEHASAPLPMARFRPNVVVDGWACPHAEDGAWRIAIGVAELGFAKLAARCAVTMVDPASGTKAGPEPLRSLAEYRRAGEGKVVFGAKFAVLRGGWLAVGDELTVSPRGGVSGGHLAGLDPSVLPPR